MQIYQAKKGDRWFQSYDYSVFFSPACYGIGGQEYSSVRYLTGVFSGS